MKPWSRRYSSVVSQKGLSSPIFNGEMLFRSSSCSMDHPGFLSEPCNFSRCNYKLSRCASLKKCSGLKGRSPSKVEISATLRRALSEGNLMHPLIRNEENNQRTPACHCCRVFRSRKNGLLVAANSRAELNRMGMMDSLYQENHDKNSPPCREVQSERDMISYPQCPLQEHKNHMTHNFFVSVNGESMSENSVMAEKLLGLKAGLNGMDLLCTERGCAPAHVDEREHIKEGSGIQDGVTREEKSSGREISSTDLYYQKMLEANPHNPLLLRNYAKFLHEEKHDTKRAEVYYSRAILASPKDGEILSLYAKFIWERHKDLSRAQNYFERAVEAAPQDCYVTASYAHFIWTCEDDEEEDDLNIQ